MVDENTFEGGYIVLLIEHQHCLLVVDWIHRAEWNGAVAVCDKNTIAHYSGCTFVAVGERLNVAEQNKRKKNFLEDIALSIPL